MSDRTHDAGQARKHATGARGARQPAGGGVDGWDAPKPSMRRTDERVIALHDCALDAADRACTQGGQAGIASGLAAIAYAILATTPEEPR